VVQRIGPNQGKDWLTMKGFWVPVDHQGVQR